MGPRARACQASALPELHPHPTKPKQTADSSSCRTGTHSLENQRLRLLLLLLWTQAHRHLHGLRPPEKTPASVLHLPEPDSEGRSTSATLPLFLRVLQLTPEVSGSPISTRSPRLKCHLWEGQQHDPRPAHSLPTSVLDPLVGLG